MPAQPELLRDIDSLQLNNKSSSASCLSIKMQPLGSVRSYHTDKNPWTMENPDRWLTLELLFLKLRTSTGLPNMRLRCFLLRPSTCANYIPITFHVQVHPPYTTSSLGINVVILQGPCACFDSPVFGLFVQCYQSRG